MFEFAKFNLNLANVCVVYKDALHNTISQYSLIIFSYH